MRIFLIGFIVMLSASVKAQTEFPGSYQNNNYGGTLNGNNHFYDSSHAQKKWFISGYSSISAGYGFFHRGGAGRVYPQFGLQLNRRLTNNLYAFAGVTVAPVYTNFNQAFLSSDLNKANSFNSFYTQGNFSSWSAATLGLMYINDEKTFSVSGSISIERSGYPAYNSNRVNTTKPGGSTLFFR